MVSLELLVKLLILLERQAALAVGSLQVMPVGDQSRVCFVTKKMLKKQPVMIPQDPHTAHSPTALVHATELHYFLSSCWYNLVWHGRMIYNLYLYLYI